MVKVTANNTDLLFESNLAVGDEAVVYPDTRVIGYMKESHSFALQNHRGVHRNEKIFYVFADKEPFNIPEPNSVYVLPKQLQKSIDGIWYKALIDNNFQETGIIKWVIDPHSKIDLDLIKDRVKQQKGQIIEEAEREFALADVKRCSEFTKNRYIIPSGTIRGVICDIYFNDQINDRIINYNSFDMMYKIKGHYYRSYPKDRTMKQSEDINKVYTTAVINYRGDSIHLPINFLLKVDLFNAINEIPF